MDEGLSYVLRKLCATSILDKLFLEKQWRISKEAAGEGELWYLQLLANLSGGGEAILSIVTPAAVLQDSCKIYL